LAGASTLQIEAETVIADGWHPWYELKSDPENANNLIICGTKWDAQRNAALGFVYASADGGRSWSAVLEDRSTTWVTEQSCAFGPNHTAYFVSEASRVIDGVTYHQQGTTRLYASTDGGRSWRETLKTGWADWSTSAVSSTSGKLYTFFNSSSTIEPGRGWGSSVGLLIFSADGKTVAGPFFNPAMQDRGYNGVYPSYAVALKSGAVVALYHALLPGGNEADLGIVRAAPSPEPTLETTMISRTRLEKGCQLLDKGSLAYDSQSNRLFVLFGDGCENRQAVLASSEDEGRTWTKIGPIAEGQSPRRNIVDPSLVVVPNGFLGLLRQDGRCSGRWLFSLIRDNRLVEPPTLLSPGLMQLEVSNDSLSNWIAPPNVHHGWDRSAPAESSITLSLYGMLNNVWRGSGLTAADGKIVAVWASGDANGMQLRCAVLSKTMVPRQDPHSPSTLKESGIDVTQQTAILYAGNQHFDRTTGSLQLCVAVANRGDTAIPAPVALKVSEMRSDIGTVSIMNAMNGLTASGAIWDISSSITGDRIPPRASSNPFCLFFRLHISNEKASRPDAALLLTLGMRVLAWGPHSSRHEAQDESHP
jgi:hypothetical protein